MFSLYDLFNLKYSLDCWYPEHKPNRALTDNQMRVRRIKNKIRKRKIRGGRK